MINAILKSAMRVKLVSADCNLRCDYCFYLEKAALYPQTKTHRMSGEVIEALIQQARQHMAGPVNIAWQGGEPPLAAKHLSSSIEPAASRIKYRALEY